VPPSSESSYTHVSTSDCPDSEFECTTLAVPRDHGEPGGETWEITFGVQPAAVESRGTFVTLTGGPGSSGLLLADAYAGFMAPEITDNFDIVFLDQRGVGLSRPVRCDEAATAYYLSDSDPDDPAQRDEVAADAQQFVDDCISEAGVPPDDLPYYATAQAVDDLEAIRAHLGAEQLVLYGESYGTQFAQLYAAKYPQRVSMLILDGVVDLTIDGLAYYEDGARAHGDVLEATLRACDADEACAAETDADTLALYDELADTLASGPIEYDFPLPNGTVDRRTFTIGDLERAAIGSLSSLGDRMLLQRAIAESADGNLIPLARLAYSAIYVDPETLDVNVDPLWSDGAYYAIECQDYAFLPAAGTPRERLDAWLDEGAAAGMADERLGSIYYGDLPCLFWPAQSTDATRPAPVTEAPYPTLVLNADTDGPTPVDNAMRVFGRLDDSSLVLLEGGPHVIFDWGYACVDELVSEAIVSGEPPSIRVTFCDGEVADPYVANAPDDAVGYDDPTEAASTIADQVTSNSEYTYWDGAELLAIGCDYGGVLRYRPTDAGALVVMRSCELTDGVPVSGTGSIDWETGAVNLELTLPDGELSYADDGTTITVDGIYDGEQVASTDTIP
jgi:pimeloyl-ACP methyl ester carboxylesterase